MARSAAEKTITDLNRRLAKEEERHAETRRILQAEISRIWRLVPSHYINLMGVYPPLKRLLFVLTEAADLQDPSRGAPIEDTMRSQFVHVGPNASTSHTEAAVATHERTRHQVGMIRDEVQALCRNLEREIEKFLDDKTRSLARLVGSEEWEYSPPEGSCAECGNDLFQVATGRPRVYCSDTCRQRASRNVTKRARS